MPDINETARWRRSIWLASAAVACWAFFAIAIGLLERDPESAKAGSFPLPYLLAVIVAPLVLTIVLFAVAAWQKAIDRRYES